MSLNSWDFLLRAKTGYMTKNQNQVIFMTGSKECPGHDPMPVATGWSHAILPQTLGQKMEMRLVENEHNSYTKRKCDSSSGNYSLFVLILSTRGGSRRTCPYLLHELQSCNLLLNNHLQENVGSHQEKIPHFQGQRRSPNKNVRGAKLHLESNPISTRDAWRAQTKPCVHQEPETPLRLSQTCLWVFERHRSAVACFRDRGSGCSRPWSCSVWHKPSWRRSPLAPP